MELDKRKKLPWLDGEGRNNGCGGHEEDNPDGGVYDRGTARMKTKDGLIGGKVYSLMAGVDNKRC